MVSFGMKSITKSLKSEIYRVSVKFARDRGGNFAILTALMAPVLIGAAGGAIEVAHILGVKTQMQDIADAASLAASTSMSEKGISEAAARKLASDWVLGMASQIDAGKAAKGLTTSVDVKTNARADGGKTFDVSVSTQYTIQVNGLLRVFGKESVAVKTASVAQSQTTVQNAMSMYLVLDKSGSMKNSTDEVKSLTTACNRYYMPNPSVLYDMGKQKPCLYTQMEVLQNASNKLFDILDSNDKDDKYIRVGSVSYNSAAQTPSALAWGRDNSRSYVSKLEPEGGTASSKAFEKAYDSLIAQAEDAAHKNKTGLTPKKFILFMTDGSNSSNSEDTKTLALCKKAKDAKITVYTVAFNAPVDAKLFLLQCATSPATYFDAVNAGALAKAFEEIGKNAVGLPTRLTQ